MRRCWRTADYNSQNAAGVLRDARLEVANQRRRLTNPCALRHYGYHGNAVNTRLRRHRPDNQRRSLFAGEPGSGTGRDTQRKRRRDRGARETGA